MMSLLMYNGELQDEGNNIYIYFFFSGNRVRSNGLEVHQKTRRNLKGMTTLKTNTQHSRLSGKVWTLHCWRFFLEQTFRTGQRNICLGWVSFSWFCENVQVGEDDLSRSDLWCYRNNNSFKMYFDPLRIDRKIGRCTYNMIV